MSLIDQFESAGLMWVKVIEQAQSDLCSRDKENQRSVLDAANYFFAAPRSSDFNDIRTFTGLCAATGINHEAAALAVWRKLKPQEKYRILMLLKDDGCNVNLELAGLVS